MLPFLKKKQIPAAAGVIIKQRAPDQPDESEANDESAAHEACAQDLLRAIENKDVKGIAAALYDAFTIMDSEPDEEGPHTYEAQNEKAAKNE